MDLQQCLHLDSHVPACWPICLGAHCLVLFGVCWTFSLRISVSRCGMRGTQHVICLVSAGLLDAQRDGTHPLPAALHPPRCPLLQYVVGRLCPLPAALHPQVPTIQPAVCRDHLTPKRIEALDGKRITMMGGGWRHAVAADDQGRMYAWGWNKVSSASQAAEMYKAVVL